MEDLTHDGQPQAVAILVVAVVLPELHDRLVAIDGPDVIPGLADVLESGEFPCMDEETLGIANANDGVDKIFVWPGYENDVEHSEATASLRSRVVNAHIDMFVGNRTRRLTIETEEGPVIRRFLAYGYKPIRERADKTVLSLHRDDALHGSDLVSQRLFSYDPPVLGFTAVQRDILLLAKQGYTDQEIAASLGKSPDSVKKRWAGIYARFAQVFPGRLPVSGDGSRGAEKRRTLLAYLRDRPEELRPYEP
jgi:DNA-binding CsgD family transcriptional regulator